MRGLVSYRPLPLTTWLTAGPSPDKESHPRSRVPRVCRVGNILPPQQLHPCNHLRPLLLPSSPDKWSPAVPSAPPAGAAAYTLSAPFSASAATGTSAPATGRCQPRRPRQCPRSAPAVITARLHRRHSVTASPPASFPARWGLGSALPISPRPRHAQGRCPWGAVGALRLDTDSRVP